MQKHARQRLSKALFHTSCIESDAQSIDNMIDNAQDITYETFRRHCDIEALSRELGYAVGNEPGLHLKDEPCASFHKSVFQGMPCYYMVQSGIEHVFIRPDVLQTHEQRQAQGLDNTRMHAPDDDGPTP